MKMLSSTHKCFKIGAGSREKSAENILHRSVEQRAGSKMLRTYHIGVGTREQGAKAENPSLSSVKFKHCERNSIRILNNLHRNK